MASPISPPESGGRPDQRFGAGHAFCLLVTSLTTAMLVGPDSGH
jgi:hypothetical protein